MSFWVVVVIGLVVGGLDQIGIELSTVESVRVKGSLVLGIFGSLI